jgi:hypothetical protein
MTDIPCAIFEDRIACLGKLARGRAQSRTWEPMLLCALAWPIALRPLTLLPVSCGSVQVRALVSLTRALGCPVRPEWGFTSWEVCLSTSEGR